MRHDCLLMVKGNTPFGDGSPAKGDPATGAAPAATTRVEASAAPIPRCRSARRAEAHGATSIRTAFVNVAPPVAPLSASAACRKSDALGTDGGNVTGSVHCPPPAPPADSSSGTASGDSGSTESVPPLNGADWSSRPTSISPAAPPRPFVTASEISPLPLGQPSPHRPGTKPPVPGVPAPYTSKPPALSGTSTKALRPEGVKPSPTMRPSLLME